MAWSDREFDSANELSKAPYSLDRRIVLKTKKDVEAVHQKIIADKGARKLPEFTVAKTDAAPALDTNVFPKYVAFRFLVGREGIDIYVSADGSPKVIGFSD